MKSLDKIVNGIVRRVERVTGYKVKQVSGGGHSLGRRFTKSELLVIGNKLKQAGFQPSDPKMFVVDAIFFETDDIYFSIDMHGFLNFM